MIPLTPDFAAEIALVAAHAWAFAQLLDPDFDELDIIGSVW